MESSSLRGARNFRNHLANASRLSQAIMTSGSNAAAMAVCFANKMCKSANFMLKEEAEKVTTIGNYFKGNTDLTSFDEFQYFTGVTSIPTSYNGNFYKCSNMTSIILPDSLTTLGGYSFLYCSSLTELVIPAGVISVSGVDTFGFCSKLKTLTFLADSVYFTNGNVYHNYFLRSCSRLTTINGNLDFSKNTYSGKYYFNGCSALETLNGKWTNIGINLYMDTCKALSHDSLVMLIDGLVDNTEGEETLTLALHANAKARLSDDEIAVATAKNWTIS